MHSLDRIILHSPKRKNPSHTFRYCDGLLDKGNGNLSQLQTSGLDAVPITLEDTNGGSDTAPTNYMPLIWNETMLNQKRRYCVLVQLVSWIKIVILLQ